MSRRRQQGIALITAIVLVALATIMAVAIGSRSALSARRSIGSFSYEQALQFAAGAEALAAFAVKQESSGPDSFARSWMQPYGPVEIAPGIALEAQVIDEQAKFNLNTLVGANGEVDKDAAAIFARLLELLGLEAKWTPLMVDWIDSDLLPGTDGAEDPTYLGQTPPYRAANMPITSVSELLQLPGFGRDRYLKLKDYVTALPPQATRINICMASPVLLDALTALSSTGQTTTEYTLMDANTLAQARSKGCFPTVNELKATIKSDTLDKRIADTTGYLRLQSWISIGTARFALYSLLQRDGSGQVRPVLRTLGTE